MRSHVRLRGIALRRPRRRGDENRQLSRRGAPRRPRPRRLPPSRVRSVSNDLAVRLRPVFHPTPRFFSLVSICIFGRLPESTIKAHACSGFSRLFLYRASVLSCISHRIRVSLPKCRIYFTCLSHNLDSKCPIFHNIIIRLVLLPGLFLGQNPFSVAPGIACFK